MGPVRVLFVWPFWFCPPPAHSRILLLGTLWLDMVIGLVLANERLMERPSRVLAKCKMVAAPSARAQWPWWAAPPPPAPWPSVDKCSEQEVRLCWAKPLRSWDVCYCNNRWMSVGKAWRNWVLEVSAKICRKVGPWWVSQCARFYQRLKNKWHPCGAYRFMKPCEGLPVSVNGATVTRYSR